MNFKNMAQCWKRANHFAPAECAADFVCTSSTLGKNYSDAYDGAETYLDQLLALDDWAQALNRAADNSFVTHDQDLRYAFASWKFRMWLDPTKLPGN